MTEKLCNICAQHSFRWTYHVTYFEGIQVYNILDGSCPEYLKDFIKLIDHGRNTRNSNNTNILKVPKINLKLGEKSFKFRASADDASTDADIVNLFADKYSNLYNSVSYDQSEINDIKCIIYAKLQNDVQQNYSVNVYDVVKAISHLKYGTSDGEEGLWSDHLIHGTHNLYVMLTLLFNIMLVHGICPKSMLLCTMVPIPKNKKRSLCDSDNYQAIALSSIFGKTFDWVILLKGKDALCSSDVQLGFKEGLSTTECTFTMLETISYYNFNHTNVYALFLDATKAFDRVHYGKFFK